MLCLDSAARGAPCRSPHKPHAEAERRHGGSLQRALGRATARLCNCYLLLAPQPSIYYATSACRERLSATVSTHSGAAATNASQGCRVDEAVPWLSAAVPTRGWPSQWVDPAG